MPCMLTRQYVHSAHVFQGICAYFKSSQHRILIQNLEFLTEAIKVLENCEQVTGDKRRVICTGFIIYTSNDAAVMLQLINRFTVYRFCIRNFLQAMTYLAGPSRR